MRKLRYFLAAVVLLTGLAWNTPMQAQQITDNAVFYHSIRSPWSNYLNPALFPSEDNSYQGHHDVFQGGDMIDAEQ